MVETKIRDLTWNVISRNKLAAINRCRKSKQFSKRSLRWHLFISSELCGSIKFFLIWNIIFMISETFSIEISEKRKRVRYSTFVQESFLLWRKDELRGLSARDIPIGCALIANPIRVVWTETRWQIDSSSVERLAEMQLKGYRLSRNKRDTNRIEAVIDRSSNSHDFETRHSNWNFSMKHTFLEGGKKCQDQYSSRVSLE